MPPMASTKRSPLLSRNFTEEEEEEDEEGGGQSTGGDAAVLVHSPLPSTCVTTTVSYRRDGGRDFGDESDRSSRRNSGSRNPPLHLAADFEETVLGKRAGVLAASSINVSSCRNMADGYRPLCSSTGV